MALSRGIDGWEPLRPEPVGRRGGAHEERRRAPSSRLATGTLACPSCDAPVLLTAASRSPADRLSCPVCLHGAAVRDFLSLSSPTRPTRVDVHVRHPGRAG